MAGRGVARCIASRRAGMGSKGERLETDRFSSAPPGTRKYVVACDRTPHPFSFTGRPRLKPLAFQDALATARLLVE